MVLNVCLYCLQIPHGQAIPDMPFAIRPLGGNDVVFRPNRKQKHFQLFSLSRSSIIFLVVYGGQPLQERWILSLKSCWMETSFPEIEFINIWKHLNLKFSRLLVP